jgi:hypothetical protein
MLPKRTTFLVLLLAPTAALAQSVRDLQDYSNNLASCERDYQDRVATRCGAGARGARCRDEMLQLARNCVRNAESRLERARLRAVNRNNSPRS